jgi:tRNA dimethylallyltransferase
LDGVAVVAPHLIAIVGPTASGKSAVALRLARELSGEIVSCDSLQVYRGLDIGSAKATPADRQEVPHHLIDVVEPDALFSAADYGRLGRQALADIVARGRLPIVAGGTGLYLRALTEGLFEGPARDEPLRRRLEALADRYGADRLHRALRRGDPVSAARIPPQDRVRVVRALEVLRVTGRPISSHHAEGTEPLPGFDVMVLGLAPERTRLRERVESRTADMFARGLLDEVRGLLARGYGPELRPLRAIGYRQAVAVLRGAMDPESAQRDIVTETMRYAKRQMTWFRHQSRAVWAPDPETAYGVATRWLSESSRR